MELEFVQWLTGEFSSHSNLSLGIGDDAAVLRSIGSEHLVVTSDTLVDGVHFSLDDQSPELIGRKSVAVNLSDLAAMACQPIAITVGLVLPSQHGIELGKRLYLGMKPLLAQWNIALAGGDTNMSDGRLIISVTAFGRSDPDRIWKRSGAKTGDQILVTGELGGSILEKHLHFTPRVSEALQLRDKYEIHSAIDISDGLLLDLYRLTQASDCGAVLNPSEIPKSKAAHDLAKLEGTRTALEHAMSDGEDFELLFTASATEAKRIKSDPNFSSLVTCIGEIIEEPGLFQQTQQARERLEPLGFVH